MKKLSMVGLRFGRLLVLKEDAVRSNAGKVKWVCRCECGKVVSVIGSLLKNSHTVSCGCRKRESGFENGKKNRTHGHSPSSGGTPTFVTWSNMLIRCYNKNHKYFKHYGGRGIAVCDSWKNSFESFLLDMGERPSGLTLDRINNDGNYEKQNCRWITMKEQCQNRSNSKKTQSPSPKGKE